MILHFVGFFLFTFCFCFKYCFQMAFLVTGIATYLLSCTLFPTTKTKSCEFVSLVYSFLSLAYQTLYLTGPLGRVWSIARTHLVPFPQNLGERTKCVQLMGRVCFLIERGWVDYFASYFYRREVMEYRNGCGKDKACS